MVIFRSCADNLLGGGRPPCPPLDYARAHKSIIQINFHFFRLHGVTFCNVHNEVGCELVLGTRWFGYELVVGTSWSGYELVLGTSWLGYEFAWYDLVMVRVDWKHYLLMILYFIFTSFHRIYDLRSYCYE